MNDPFDLNAPSVPKEPRPKCIVRLTTAAWGGKDGIHIKKSLRFLKRQCEGFNVLAEDISMIGAEKVVPRIINLYDCKDGVYQIVTCNESSDWETPHIIDDYDYELIPLK